MNEKSVTTQSAGSYRDTGPPGILPAIPITQSWPAAVDLYCTVFELCLYFNDLQFCNCTLFYCSYTSINCCCIVVIFVRVLYRQF